MITVATLSDPVLGLESLGYTEREAAFLHLVAIHSGYFLRRQFDYFTDRNKGAIVVRFLDKARRAGHIEQIDYMRGWPVYHLYSRTVYRIVGDAESQNRRRKGDAQVRARLMGLDYILENESDRFLESEAERVCFLSRDRRIAPNVFSDAGERMRPLLSAFPLSIADRRQPATSIVRFAFLDEGLATIEKFLRYLATAEPLLRGVGNFEVVYLSSSAFNFPAAKAAFWNRFSPVSDAAPRLFEDVGLRTVKPQSSAIRPRFTTVLLEYSYPKLMRSETRGSRTGSHLTDETRT